MDYRPSTFGGHDITFGVPRVRDFTIRSNTNGLGLRSNAIKNLCLLILHQLVVGWIGKAHGLSSGIRAGTL